MEDKVVNYWVIKLVKIHCLQSQYSLPEFLER